MFLRQLKNELLKLFAKKRTYIGFAMLILAQLLIVSLLRFSKPAHQGLRHTIERNGLDAGKYVSMLTVATFIDRKSTRLNSSHLCISYAVFCLKKQKQRRIYLTAPRALPAASSVSFLSFLA